MAFERQAGGGGQKDPDDSFWRAVRILFKNHTGKAVATLASFVTLLGGSFLAGLEAGGHRTEREQAAIEKMIGVSKDQGIRERAAIENGFRQVELAVPPTSDETVRLIDIFVERSIEARRAIRAGFEKCSMPLPGSSDTIELINAFVGAALAKRCPPSTAAPKELVPGMVKETSVFPSELAGSNSWHNGKGAYAVQLDIEPTKERFAGACWSLSRGLSADVGQVFRFSYRGTTNPARVEVKFETDQPGQIPGVVLRQLVASSGGGWNDLDVNASDLEEPVRKGIKRICIAITGKSRGSEDRVEFDLSKVVLQD
jgi:hypothetical protein